MRLLDTYALAAGSKIDKPFIFEQYFPLSIEKYITIQCQSKMESKDYDFWQDVINLIFPVLQKNKIQICQIGGAVEQAYQNVIDLRGKTDLNQLAYIIKNSLLHIGPDSVGVHIASSYDVPIVGLYSVSPSSVSGPHFGSKEKQILFDAHLRTPSQRASYSTKESPKTINLIRPEEIADAVFKLINIEEKVPFKTIFVGSKYSSKFIRELVPTKAVQIANAEIPIEIRMDIHFDEKVLAEQMNLSRAIIVSNKRIDKNLLSTFRSKIAAFIYIIEENGDEPQFISEIRELAFPIVLVTNLSNEKINPKKIHYYEHASINISEPEQPEKWDYIRQNIEKIYFRSNKILLEDGKVYNSNICRIKKEPLVSDFDYYKAIDIPEFWDELPFLTLVLRG